MYYGLAFLLGGGGNVEKRGVGGRLSTLIPFQSWCSLRAWSVEQGQESLQIPNQYCLRKVLGMALVSFVGHVMCDATGELTSSGANDRSFGVYHCEPAAPLGLTLAHAQPQRDRDRGRRSYTAADARHRPSHIPRCPKAWDRNTMAGNYGAEPQWRATGKEIGI